MQYAVGRQLAVVACVIDDEHKSGVFQQAFSVSYLLAAYVRHCDGFAVVGIDVCAQHGGIYKRAAYDSHRDEVKHYIFAADFLYESLGLHFFALCSRSVSWVIFN